MGSRPVAGGESPRVLTRPTGPNSQKKAQCASTGLNRLELQATRAWNRTEETIVKIFQMNQTGRRSDRLNSTQAARLVARVTDSEALTAELVAAAKLDSATSAACLAAF
jgi:hypothetical protein